MKTPHPRTAKRTQGFTLIELLVVISIIAILAGLGMKAFPAAMKKGRLTDSTNNAKQILLTMKMFAQDNEGAFPATAPSTDGGKTAGEALTTGKYSNLAFDNLISSGKYPIGKTFFVNKNSKYCKSAKVDGNLADSKTVGKGQCDWLYVVGFGDSTNGNWPLIATATKSAADLTWTSDKNALGGVWEGTDAIIGFCDGSVKQAGEKDMDQSTKTATLMKSPIDPAKNIFTGTAEWLGESVIILAPEPGS